MKFAFFIYLHTNRTPTNTAIMIKPIITPADAPATIPTEAPADPATEEFVSGTTVQYILHFVN